MPLQRVIRDYSYINSSRTFTETTVADQNHSVTIMPHLQVAIGLKFLGLKCKRIKKQLKQGAVPTYLSLKNLVTATNALLQLDQIE